MSLLHHRSGAKRRRFALQLPHAKAHANGRQLAAPAPRPNPLAYGTHRRCWDQPHALLAAARAAGRRMRMDAITSFGEWLRRARKVCDLTQADLAQRVGCAEGTIRNLEADGLRPSKQLAVRLAAQLGLASDAQAAIVGFARGGMSPVPALPTLPA